MEENDQNQNIDGVKPVSNVDGFVTNPRPINPNTTSQGDESSSDTQDSTSQTPNHEVEVAKLKEQKKGMAIWLVVLLVVLFAGAAAAAVYFYQSNQSKKELDAAKAQTSQAQKDLAAQKQSTTQQQIDDLNKQVSTLKTENATLQKTVDAQAAYIKQLTTTATQLKTACGTACGAITIPTPPAGVTSTTTTTTTKTN